MFTLLTFWSLADPSLPTLPDQFDTWVTCNIVNKNYSVVVHEIFDGPNNRALLSRWHGGNQGDPEHGMVRSMYFFDIGEFFHVNSTSCVGGQLDSVPFGPFAHAHRTPTSKELFNFAQDGQTEMYMGTETVQGVPCNHWRSIISFPNASSMTLDYYFSVPGWATPESNSSEVPVLLHLTGSRASRFEPGGVYTFDHYYSYSHFRVGALEEWSKMEFYISSAIPCQGNITSLPQWSTLSERDAFCEANCFDDGNHDHGGTYFGFVVLGVVIAVLVISCTSFLCGRKLGQTFKPMMTEMGVSRDKSGTDAAVRRAI